jgi:ankyrin repeat protein
MYNYGGRPTGLILPLAISRRADSYRVIKFLLEIGADVDATDPEPYEVLYGLNNGSAATIASYDQIEDEVLELLLAYGARTDIKNFEGLDCLGIAKKCGSKRKVELLESYNRR